MLLTIEDVRDGLRSKFTHPKFDLSRMVLVEPGVTADVVKAVQSSLQVDFPASFAEYVVRFDFSKFDLLNMVFAYGQGLLRFVQTNLGQPYPWWRGNRPTDLLWISHTNSHYLVMDTRDGVVRAFEKASAVDKGVVSEHFGLLVRGAGTLAIRETKETRIELAKEIAHDVGAQASGTFWQQLAGRSA